MTTTTYDRQMERDSLNQEFGCCECGYRKGIWHHLKIRCPKSGRCGNCGNDWPCEDCMELLNEGE